MKTLLILLSAVAAVGFILAIFTLILLWIARDV